MQIEQLQIAALIPYARNSRTHSDEQVAQIAASIREFGFTNPVLIDGEGGIIAGHGRVLGARKLGLAQVPCIRLAHLTEAQRRAYVIADNQIGLNSGWDDDVLADELHLLKIDDFDLSLTGFAADDLEKLLLEEIPPPPQNYGGQPVKEKLLVMVECKTDAEQRAVLEQLTRGGHECRALTS